MPTPTALIGFTADRPQTSEFVPATSVVMVRPGAMDPTKTEVVINPALSGQDDKPSSIYTSESIAAIGERMKDAGVPLAPLPAIGIFSNNNIVAQNNGGDTLLNPAAIKKVSFPQTASESARIGVEDGRHGLTVLSCVTDSQFAAAMKEAGATVSLPPAPLGATLATSTVAKFSPSPSSRPPTFG